MPVLSGLAPNHAIGTRWWDLLQVCEADQDWVDASSQRGGWRRGWHDAGQRVQRPVPSGLAPAPLADEGSVGYRAASHSGADEDAVLGMRIGSRDRATRAHRPGLSPVPLPGVWQTVQRAQ